MTAHAFASNIYPGAICEGPQGCGRPWEEHPEAVPYTGAHAYVQDALGLPCLGCGEAFADHDLRWPTFYEVARGVGVGETPGPVAITLEDRGGLRKFRGGPED
jgi:hypothetical protein